MEPIPTEKWLDTRTRVDELLVRQIEQNDLMIEALGASTKEHLIITYPIEGGTEELIAGVSTFDFVGGTVTGPTGIVTRLSDALHEHEFQHCHSIVVDAELPVDIRIDNAGAITTKPGIPFTLSDTRFKKVKVTTTRNTNVAVWASTSVKATYIEPGIFYSGNPYVFRDSVTAAGTPEELDIRTTLGRNAHIGFIANMGNTAGVLRVYEYDGISWTTEYYTIPKDGVELLEKADIASIRIDSDVNATQFEVNLR